MGSGSLGGSNVETGFCINQLYEIKEIPNEVNPVDLYIFFKTCTAYRSICRSYTPLCFPFALQRRNARSIATANTGVTIEIAKIVVDLFVDRDEEVLLVQISPSDV